MTTVDAAPAASAEATEIKIEREEAAKSGGAAPLAMRGASYHHAQD